MDEGSARRLVAAGHLAQPPPAVLLTSNDDSLPAPTPPFPSAPPKP